MEFMIKNTRPRVDLTRSSVGRRKKFKYNPAVLEKTSDKFNVVGSDKDIYMSNRGWKLSTTTMQGLDFEPDGRIIR